MADGDRKLDALVGAATAGIVAAMLVQALQLVGVVDRYRPSTSGLSVNADLGVSGPSELLSVLWVVLVLATGVLVVVTFLRAYTNARALGLPLSPDRRWYTASWVVPLVNLIGPYEVTAAIWQHATGSASRRLVRWWWAAWVLTLFRIQVWYPDESGAKVLGPGFRIYGAVLALALGALTIAVLRTLAAGQAAKARERTALAPLGRAERPSCT